MFDPAAMIFPTAEEIEVRLGDWFTIGGMFRRVPNPARKWWFFWRPRWIASSDLQQFRVWGTLP